MDPWLALRYLLLGTKYVLFLHGVSERESEPATLASHLTFPHMFFSNGSIDLFLKDPHLSNADAILVIFFSTTCLPAKSGEKLRAPVLSGCFLQGCLPLLFPGFGHRLHLLPGTLRQGALKSVSHALLCSFSLSLPFILHVVLYRCLCLLHLFLKQR